VNVMGDSPKQHASQMCPNRRRALVHVRLSYSLRRNIGDVCTVHHHSSLGRVYDVS
jgi:hypothetical protein